MFSGIRSDSVALSCVWLGLPGGRFQSDGGNCTVMVFTRSIACDVAKASHPCSVTMSESGGLPDTLGEIIEKKLFG